MNSTTSPAQSTGLQYGDGLRLMRRALELTDRGMPTALAGEHGGYVVNPGIYAASALRTAQQAVELLSQAPREAGTVHKVVLPHAREGINYLQQFLAQPEATRAGGQTQSPTFMDPYMRAAEAFFRAIGYSR